MHTRIRIFEQGFSLLELILAIAILSILAGTGFSFLGNYKQKFEVQGAADMLAGKLKEIRSRTLYGAEFKRWGMHVANPNSGPDNDKPFFEIYTCNTAVCTYSADVTIQEKVYLSSFVTFTTPASGATCEIIFEINTGKRASASTCSSGSVVLQLRGSSSTKTVTVASEGSINVQ